MWYTGSIDTNNLCPKESIGMFCKTKHSLAKEKNTECSCLNKNNSPVKKETMALTDNPATKERTPKVRSVQNKHTSWSDKQKIEAVQSWLLLGNLALTSRILSIPEITLRVWKASEWWKSAVEDIKQSEKVKLSARLEKIVDASLTAVEDRLLNGDYIYDAKSQQMIRKQVALRDAHKVATDLMNKQDTLEKAVAPAEAQISDETRMQKLANMFAQAVIDKQKKPELEIVDVVMTDISEKE